MAFFRIFSIFIICLIFFSCAENKKDDLSILPAEQIYNQSMDKLEHKKYQKAVEGFADLERTYPYSKWAIKAQIMSAYTSFKAEEYTDSIVTLEKFIALHPGNSDIAYAYYLKAMCYYEQISDVGRDQSDALSSLTALREIIARFPETRYAQDAQIKVDLVLDHLAGKELEIGRFYLKQKRYIAAINRFKEVINKYQTTSHVPEALHRLVEAHAAMGLKEEARKYAAVLGYNFPGSKWYDYSYTNIEGKSSTAHPKNAKKLKVLARNKFNQKHAKKLNILDKDSVYMKPAKRLSVIKSMSLDSLKKQPNLVDSFDKNANEIGKKDRVKVQPLSPVNRNVIVNPVQ